MMADLKFSCPHCGQHISCDELWSGHQIPCPACQQSFVVPGLLSPPSSAGPPPHPLVPQPPVSDRPKLSAGATQLARSVPGPTPRKQAAPRPPKTGNPIPKFLIVAVLLAIIGAAGYLYVPGLLNRVQETGTSKAPAPANTSANGGVGPMGEVNGAMDVSETLDGGAVSRPPPPTPAAAPQQAAAPKPAAARSSTLPATNSAPRTLRRRPH